MSYSIDGFYDFSNYKTKFLHFSFIDSDVSELDAVISHHETVRRMQSDLENKNVEIENLRKAVVDAETSLEEMTEENKQLTYVQQTLIYDKL